MTYKLHTIKKNSFFGVKLTKDKLLLLLFILFFDFILYPIPILASEINISDDTNIVEEIVESFKLEKKLNFTNSFPETEEVKSSEQGFYTITAYNSEVAQCDSTPCITANGFNVCEHGIEDTIAANFLKFGTKVRIPEFFGDRIFIVRDRMNRRYTSRIDVWMKHKHSAIAFGKKYTKIEVLE